MPLNQGSCRDCGGRLLGTDRGRCGDCRQATETPQERAAFLFRDRGNATETKPPKGNVTKVERPKSNATKPKGNATETKQQRWAKKNADRRREIDRAGQQRRRS